MGQPINEDRAAEVRWMLLLGRAQCEIVSKTRLSAATISKIVNNKWRPCLRQEDRPTAQQRCHMWRCHGCGAMVYNWPCLYCEHQRKECA